MKILSLDTSSKRFSVAVSVEGKVVARMSEILQKKLSTAMMGRVDKLLKRSEIKLKEIDGLAVGLGPGTFTGLRVGLAAVKGLAFALDVPVVGMSSLDVLAMAADDKGRQICTICDAKRSLVYVCFFEKKNGILKRKGKYLLTDIKDVLRQINKETIFIGDGIKIYGDQLKSIKKYSVKFADEKKWYPQARYLSLLAEQRFKDNKIDNIDKLVPLYLYPQDCQVRR